MKAIGAFFHGIKFLVAFRIVCLFGTFHSKVNKHRFNTKDSLASRTLWVGKSYLVPKKMILRKNNLNILD